MRVETRAGCATVNVRLEVPAFEKNPEKRLIILDSID